MTSMADALALRWAHRDDFTILDAGFRQAAGFLATWAAWLADPNRCKRLFYIALGACGELTSGSALSQRLANALPVLTPGLHTLSFDEDAKGSVTVLLGIGDVTDLVPQLVAWVDAFDLTALPPQTPSPHRDHGWLSRLARLAAPGCLAMASANDAAVLEGLGQSGFKIAKPFAETGAQAGHLIHLDFKPHHTPIALVGGLWLAQLPAAARHALVVGAGLAGCSAARALARQGWRITLIDAHAEPAQAASGNAGGLFHSIVHGEDGIHARAHRAAAMRTAAVVAPWLSQQRVAGQCQGLLRLDNTTTAAGAEALAQRLGLPPTHVEWLDQPQAECISGLPVPSGGWLFRQGGWLDPAAYARAMLDEAKACSGVAFLPHRQALRLCKSSLSEAPLWQALDEAGSVIAEAPVVVLASAIETLGLIDALPGAAALPLSSVRGQLSTLPLDATITAPRIPVAGAGYALPAHQGRMLFGATSQADDPDTRLRPEDHALNIQQAAQLGCLTLDKVDRVVLEGIQGRVGWRAATPDRLPYVGPLPLKGLTAKMQGQRAPRTDQPRFIPRLRDEHGGVYVITGFGSRGITWAALAGELLASWVTGSPSPIEASLRDALDPARIVTRAKAKARSG